MNIAPVNLIEGTNIFKNLTDLFGEQPLIIVKEEIKNKFYLNSITNASFFIFKTDCSYEQAERAIQKSKQATSIVGIGGGKVLDLAKFVAFKTEKKMITVPTSAATGAASSALSAMYTEEGASLYYELLGKAADLVILDYAMILDAPIDFLKFGAADALAKYYESMASTGGFSTDIFVQTALNLATNIKDYIFKYLPKALEDAKNKNISEEFKNIVKINVVLAPTVGGFGGEATRAVAAHAFNNAMTQIPRMRKFLHGEVVGFGNIFQLLLEGKKEELAALKNFYEKIDLKYDFKLNKKELENFLDYITNEKETLRNMSKQFTKDELREYLKELGICN